MSKLFTASSAISAASAYIGYQGAKAEGKSIQAAQEYNAAISENQAEVEQRQTEEQIRRMRVVNREILDNQTARRAGAGVDVSTGSALIASAETAGRLELEVFEENRASQGRQDQLRSQAAMDRFSGNQARKASKYKAGEALFRGAGQIASTFI
jgi:hypothetical protein